MSFPTKLLSTSPSLQRDYGLIRSQIASANQWQKIAAPETLSESDEGEDEANADNVTEAESSMSASADQDNMSNLSMSADGLIGRRRRRSRSSRASLSSTTPQDQGRGIGRAALDSEPISYKSPERACRPSVIQGEAYGGMTQVVGIPSSYILGGQHMMPPADADLRSQEDIDNDFEEMTDDESTPVPRVARAGWLEDHERTPRPRFNRGEYMTGPISESSPLLGHSREQSYQDGEPNRLTAFAKTGATSGWDYLQPSPPGPEELEQIAAEVTSGSQRLREVQILIQYLIPTWGTHILELSLNIVSVFSLGHLGVNELAASSLSSMTANVTGYSIISGFVSALDSLLPGAYTSQPKTVGLITQRMTVIIAYLLPPIMLIWFFAERLLLLLGQDPVVAALAGLYLRILCAGLPGYAGFEICRRYLQAQGLFHAPTVVLLFVSPFNALLNWLLVYGPEPIRIGFIGAPIASVVSSWLMCLLCFLQCYIAPRIAWDGFSPLAFKGLRPIATLGFHGTVAMVAEWWSWEIVGLTTSLLGTTSLAAQSVLLVSSSISYQLPYALSVAAAVRVGNLLGALQPKQANIASDMALLLSVVSGTLNSGLFLIFRSRWGGWFTQDEEVIMLIYRVMPLLAAFQLFDSLCGVAAGILRGIGRQQAGAFVNVTAYYAIGIPIGLALTFSRLQWGLAGLWTGLTIALIYAAFFCCLIIKRTDWQVEMQKSIDRMGNHSQKPDNVEEIIITPSSNRS